MEIREIFDGALDITDPGRRSEYLDEACEGDPELRGQIEELLGSQRKLGSFLEHPAVESIPTEVLVDTMGAPKGAAGSSCSIPHVDDISLPFLEPAQRSGSIGRLGQYDVLEVVGCGGMGIVLKAQDVRLNRVVAVKVLAPELAANATARKRFLREAQAAAAVSHDHVVTIYAVEENETSQDSQRTIGKRMPFLVMAFIDGQSLQQKIDHGGPLELKEILRIGRQIAAGLGAAHQQGLIHRDVKLANILLQNGVERVQITDFGLARAVDDVGITRTGEVTGTPQYMSPEQAQGQPVDARSDLFSLGSVLYAMCTGRSPFRADSTMASLRRVCDDTPRPIREINPDIPVWLVAIIERLLAKDPAERFRSADDVAELLGQCLAHVQHLTLNEKPAEATPTKLEEIVGPELAARIKGDPEASSDDGPDAIVRARRARCWLPRIGGRWGAACAALLVLIGLLTAAEGSGVTHFAGTMIRLVTGEGTLIIEVDDPTVQVSIDGDQIRIRGGGVEQLQLRPGQYKFTATKDGKPIKTQLVSITRGGKEVVRVSLEGHAPDATATLQDGDNAEWVSLFNGKDLTGWEPNPDSSGDWTVEEGLLVGRGTRRSYLFSKRGDFENFHLRVEARINSGGNSGVLFRANKPLRAYEAQICADVEGQPKTGSIWKFHPPPKCIARTDSILAPADQWFTLEVSARGMHLLVKVNGTPATDLVDHDQPLSKGHLALQMYDEDCVVRFRKIEIRELPPSEPAAESLSGKKLPEIFTRELVQPAAELAERGEFGVAAREWNGARFAQQNPPMRNFLALALQRQGRMDETMVEHQENTDTNSRYLASAPGDVERKQQE